MSFSLVSHVCQVSHESLQVGGEVIANAVWPRLIAQKERRESTVLKFTGIAIPFIESGHGNEMSEDTILF